MKIPKKILSALSEPLPLEPRPFAIMASRAGVSERVLLSSIRDCKKKGYIKRVGVVLSHYKAGYKVNAMVAWKVTPKKIEKTGKTLARFPQVTHCYARQSYPQWPYNLYTMVHARNKRESQAVIKNMIMKAGAEGHLVLSTIKEFKKVKSDLREILK